MPIDSGSALLAVAVLVTAGVVALFPRWTTAPGQGALVLAVLAFLIPLLAEPMTPLEKALWSGAFFSLAAVEMVAINRARRKQADQFERTQQRLTELQAVIVAELRTKGQLEAVVAADVPESGLKRRALSLSD